MTVGEKHGCVIDGNGVLKSWGNNEHDETGIGFTTDDCFTTRVDGNHLYEDVAAGSQVTCAIRAGSGDRDVECWGRNDKRQQGNSSGPDSNNPDPVVCP